MEPHASKIQDTPNTFAHSLEVAGLNFCPQCQLTHDREVFSTIFVVIARKAGAEEDPEEPKFVREFHLYEYCERCADFALAQNGSPYEYAHLHIGAFAFEVYRHQEQYFVRQFGAVNKIALEKVIDHRFPVFTGIIIPRYVLEKFDLL